MFRKILIANRGEIACRVMRTAAKMGIKTVAVYSEADANALHVAMADEAVLIGPAPASESYLKGDAIIAAALACGAEAIHPGYGFLSENPDFAESVLASGLCFIGPSADSIRAMGLKDAAKALMTKAGVPVVPGYHGAKQDPAYLKTEADKIGYPVLIKARAGGGGKGMRLVERGEDFADLLESAAREGQSAFGDPAVLIEKYITSPRHIEVQVFGDAHGEVVHLFERDCSLQRRHQKVIEEAPAPGMTEALRGAMTSAAVTAAKAINYEGAGTIEFILDGSGPLREDGFWFMEMNTRLQVEHPVTEAITGLDLVELQILIAAGQALPFAQADLHIHGHAFEARLYAENVPAGFIPATGTLAHLSFSKGARSDTGVASGGEITPFYDPMIAKVITQGETRSEALDRLRAALKETHVAGTVTNLDFLQALAGHEGFSRGEIDTGLIERSLPALTETAPPDSLAVAIAMIAASGLGLGKPSWRLWDEAKHRLSLVQGSETFSLRLAEQNDGALRFEDPESGEVQVTLEQVSLDGALMNITQSGVRRSAQVVVFERGGEKQVSVLKDGRAHEFTVPDPLAASSPGPSNDDVICAPMTGIVRAVEVKAGDQVQCGDRLLVLEAMKMELRLDAPRDGLVKEVCYKAGAAVEGGAIVVHLEEQS